MPPHRSLAPIRKQGGDARHKTVEKWMYVCTVVMLVGTAMHGG